MNVTHNMLSKRKLNALCTGGLVRGWDDPRLLTLAGLRRRGAPPAAINAFVRAVGVSRNENLIPISLLDHHIRDNLNASARRAMAVLRPLRVVLTNVGESATEVFRAPMYPQHPARSSETYDMPLTRVLYIESSDFRTEDAKGYFGLAPGKAVLLRYAHPITCDAVVIAPSGSVVELRCSMRPLAAGEKPPKGVVHWVAQPKPGVAPPKLEARLYDVLFASEDPSALAGDEWVRDLNPNSEVVVVGGYAGPGVADAPVGTPFQLERLGYFAVDPDTTPQRLVVNRTVSLRDGFKDGGR